MTTSRPGPALVTGANSGIDLESRRPRQRYIVGLDARATIATQPFIPRQLTDFAMRLVAELRGR